MHASDASGAPAERLPADAESLPRRLLDRALTLTAIALMVYGAFWPIFGYPVGQGAQRMAMLAAGTTFVGGLLVPRGSRVAFTLLWAAFGLSAALGTIAIFSVGFVYWIAAALILLAIVATPNDSGVAHRYDWSYIAAFYAGYLLLFLPFII